MLKKKLRSVNKEKISDEKNEVDKSISRKQFLEKIKSIITIRPTTIHSPQLQSKEEERSGEDLLNYVKWMCEKGYEEYKVNLKIS